MVSTIFISSVQRELAEERRAIGDFIHRDPLMRRFFSVVLFEDLPASDHRADDVYLSEVDPLCREAGLPEPQFTQTDSFTVTIERRPQRAFEAVTPEVPRKYPASTDHEAQDEAHEPMIAIERTILMSCAESPKSTSDLLRVLGYSSRTGNFKKAIVRLLESGSLELTIPDKPRSGRQRYRLTSGGKTRLDEHGRLNR